jgi:N-acyl-D-amino-acid deacylase
MHDLIIRNAQVYDGLGGPPLMADVAVSQGCITHIGQVDGPARDNIDAQGLALMPGIVDLHTHYDAQVTWDRTLSPSPALGRDHGGDRQLWFWHRALPGALRETMLKNLSVVEGMDLQSLLTGVDWQFESFGQYMDQLRRIGPYVNTAVFAGPLGHPHRRDGRRRLCPGRSHTRTTADHEGPGARRHGPRRHWFCVVVFAQPQRLWRHPHAIHHRL